MKYSPAPLPQTATIPFQQRMPEAETSSHGKRRGGGTSEPPTHLPTSQSPVHQSARASFLPPRQLSSEPTRETFLWSLYGRCVADHIFPHGRSPMDLVLYYPAL